MRILNLVLLVKRLTLEPIFIVGVLIAAVGFTCSVQSAQSQIVTQLSSGQWDEPVPELDLEEQTKLMIVRLNFDDPNQVSLNSAEIISGKPHANFGDPPQLHVRILDDDEKVLEEFNAWDPRFDDEDEFIASTEVIGRFVFPFSSNQKTMEVIDVPNQEVLISIDLDTIFRTYLPTIANNPAPDLVVKEIVVFENSLQIVIVNEGTRPATTPFWVDLYVDPDPVPTDANHIWADGRSQYGLVWGVTTDIPVDGTLTLTVGDPYYWASLSHWPGTLSADTPIYVQVDSANTETTYGGVLELHEISGGAYNNIVGPLYLATNDAFSIPMPRTPDKVEEIGGQLPLRPK